MENKENKPASGKKHSGKKKTPSSGERKNRQLRSARREGGLVGMLESLTLEEIQAQPKGIGLVYDERMVLPHCDWDANYPERPERLTDTWKKCCDYGLVDRCQRIAARAATKEEILLHHTEEYYDTIYSTRMMDQAARRILSATYDGICIYKDMYEGAMLAAGSSIELTDQVLQGKIRNGLALVRPPGHHAMEDKACGYCVFNNVALAAKHAVDILGMQRVLVVDWDVHHGQGTQYAFYDDPRVLYFSIHRYEHGNFWPNLRESDYDHIGTGRGKGYNINVPFNKTGMTDGDYLAIIHQILLPVAHQFDPQLVLISAGYDAATGDPEGQSEVSPACYAHITHLLKSLANGKICAILEGGYCLKSQAEAVALTLRSLLDDPCPVLRDLPEPLYSTWVQILHVIRVLRPYWKCFAYHQNAEKDSDLPDYFSDIQIPKLGVIFSSDENRPDKYDIEGDYEKYSCERIQELDQIIDDIITQTELLTTPHRTCLVYDERMRKHRYKTEAEDFMSHPERPDRISRIYEKHKECGLLERCKQLPSRIATDKELILVHRSTHVDHMKRYKNKSKEELRSLESTYNSIYLSADVFECAALATGCTLNLVDEVITGQCRNGVAIVRPPGHHAEPHTAMGFCYFNSAAVAARYAQEQHGAQRVLILDWDVHHGNGTQHMFVTDPTVLYISIHRHDNGFFFPTGPAGDYQSVGYRQGEGFNVNIPWNNRSMGDAEYVAAFQQIVMPIAYEFCPDFVVVSAGFDAARGDPLGGCRVSPDCYGYMTHMLSSLANGRVILVLEGGYNLHAISESMAACTSVLLGDVCPRVTNEQPCDSAVESICNVLNTHEKYWKSLRYRVKMPSISKTKEWLMSCAGTQGEEDTSISSCPNTPSPVLNDTTDSEGTRLEGVEPLEGSEVTLEVKVEAPSADSDVDQLTADLAKVSVSAATVSKESHDHKGDDLIGACGGGDADNPPITMDGMDYFAVVPLPWCPHLKTVTTVPLTGLDTNAPCIQCGNVGENWVCLTCYQVHCSRYVNEHMLMHGLETDHRMVLSYADLSVWCFSCDAYVHHEDILEAKRVAHMHKFEEDIPQH